MFVLVVYIEFRILNLRQVKQQKQRRKFINQDVPPPR